MWSVSGQIMGRVAGLRSKASESLFAARGLRDELTVVCTQFGFVVPVVPRRGSSHAARRTNANSLMSVFIIKLNRLGESFRLCTGKGLHVHLVKYSLMDIVVFFYSTLLFTFFSVLFGLFTFTCLVLFCPVL